MIFFHYWQPCLSHVSQPKALVSSEVYHIFITLRICVNRMDWRLKESKLECQVDVREGQGRERVDP